MLRVFSPTLVLTTVCLLSTITIRQLFLSPVIHCMVLHFQVIASYTKPSPFPIFHDVFFKQSA